MAVMALLAAIVAPKYIAHIDAAKEAALRQDLVAIRDAIDKFYADNARYPKDLQELINSRYLRSYPMDPVTDSTEDWIFLKPVDGTEGVLDIRSGSSATARDGSRYQDW